MARRDQVLLIDPPNEISFTGDFTQRVCKTKLGLSNPTDMNIAYKVKTTAPRRYCVRPNSGQIKPGDTAEVNIMLQPSQNNEDLNRHKFMVQSIELATQEYMDTPVDDLFRSVNSSEVMSKKLYCQFNNIPDTTADGAELPVSVEEPTASQIEESAAAAPQQQQLEQQTYEAEASSAGGEEIKRPVISAVPTEPKIIPQEPAVAAAQVKKVAAEQQETTAAATTAKLTPVKSAAKTEQSSRQTVVDSNQSTSSSSQENEALKKKNQQMQREIANLGAQLKSVREKLNAAHPPSSSIQPIQGEDPATVKKVMIILFVIAFILGWMISSFFCKSC